MAYEPPPSTESYLIVFGIVVGIALTPFIAVAALIVALAYH